ncbi:hypothetical protein HZH68_013066 [Vespula germanica]|uniref:Uncharacterized protein n=1 Tax=Vespula germanica TaxID=30212 RepID=A0A834JHW4_VESGE|nr:hypothetical protein HZH68_013066 [Vespula germanica]
MEAEEQYKNFDTLDIKEVVKLKEKLKALELLYMGTNKKLIVSFNKLNDPSVKLDDEHSKILIGIRLVLEWLYFKSELLEVNLFLQFKNMFHHHPNKIILHRKFEEHSWIKEDKVSMEDRVAVFYPNLQQLETLSILKDRNIEIGINGNEIADKLIKKATKRVI